MSSEFALATAVAAVPLPAQSGVTGVYETVHLADAFSIRLPQGAARDPDVLARFLFAQQPAWVGMLMRIRDTIVGRLGLKTGKHLATLESTARAGRVGIFKVYSTSDTEIVVGEDDRHLDFRVSVLCSGSATPQLTVSTVVHCHNLLGRVYLFVIAPFHRMVVKASLRRAGRIGWPAAVPRH
ncbi:DUF2867 domain-containing protein [Massilia sp. Dwa41.01b]|uniref:DUF2867 domain-containing protein n=1 Tax=unclassified Massilia TaxID=2609279 RepID=UPI0015FFA6D7|nr:MULTISPECIES: DUF2867 domain-containing protein [unclassified Massilia]QNA90251.1 DUF2867 domain-containing protein [Massilia sp. Dwa41.01b]QNB01149.1 DUF2867 domain-containing protein [Massilia sp. Se16.2.3]